MLDIEKLYKLYFKDIYYFALYLSKNEDIAKEITSETFFKFLKYSEKTENISSVKSYIFKIAKNIFLDYLEKNKFEKIDISSIELISEKLNPEEEFLKTETINEINFALLKLEEDDRLILKLRVFEELSFKEIGNFFGKNENWACVKFHRAKEKLKKLMEVYYE